MSYRCVVLYPEQALMTVSSENVFRTDIKKGNIGRVHNHHHNLIMLILELRFQVLTAASMKMAVFWVLRRVVW
jgi:hypothetical protein